MRWEWGNHEYKEICFAWRPVKVEFAGRYLLVWLEKVRRFPYLWVDGRVKQFRYELYD